jgi:hypothetical protein
MRKNGMENGRGIEDGRRRELDQLLKKRECDGRGDWSQASVMVWR